MRLCYRTGVGTSAMSMRRVIETLNHLTMKQGQKMDAPESVHKIEPFIQLHKLNIFEVEKELKEYKSFNQFFYRRLKLGARIAAAPDDDSIAIAPADARTMVFRSIDEAKSIWIKGVGFGVHNLIGEYGKNGKADEFLGASLVISRLAPQDYHRWHFPVSGVQKNDILLMGLIILLTRLLFEKKWMFIQRINVVSVRSKQRSLEKSF